MNITSNLREQIEREIQLIPKELKELIDTFEWEKISEEIGKNNKLTEKEIITLQTETVLVLIGLVRPDLYIQNLENNLALTEEEAKKIGDEVLKKIFIPIADKIEEISKNKTKNIKTTWKQNINFILSGGNYSVFLERLGENNQLNNIQTNQLPINNSKVEDLKNKFTI